MADAVNDGRPLTVEDLAAHLATGCKPHSAFRVGSEHEKFVFRTGSHEPVPYGVDAEGRGGIHALMEGLMRFGWSGVYEDSAPGPTLIGLTRGGGNIRPAPWPGNWVWAFWPLATLRCGSAKTCRSCPRAATP